MSINEAIENASEGIVWQVRFLTKEALEFVQNSETGNSKENRANDDNKSAKYLRLYDMFLGKYGWDKSELRKDRTPFGNLKHLLKKIDMEKLEKMAN